jgi:hypothetical protein
VSKDLYPRNLFSAKFFKKKLQKNLVYVGSAAFSASYFPNLGLALGTMNSVQQGPVGKVTLPYSTKNFSQDNIKTYVFKLGSIYM